MGFNFGSFLGGMSQQISTNIEEAKAFNREKEFRMDMLAEEEATKMRLMKAERREKENKRQKENASLLKAVGYTDAQASWIMQGGDASVSLYADWGSQAYAKGINPADILGSNLVNSDQQDPRNEATLNSVLSNAMPRPEEDAMTAQPFTIRQDIMTGILGEVKKPKKVQQVSSTKEGWNTALNGQITARMEYGENSQEYADATEVLKFWEDKMATEAANEKKAEEEKLKSGELFSKSSRPAVMKAAYTHGAKQVGTGISVDLETGIYQAIEGKEGQAIIANYYTAEYLYSQAMPLPNQPDVKDDRMMNDAKNLKATADSQLNNYSADVVASTYTKQKAKEQFATGTGENYFKGSYLRNHFNEEGELFIPSMIDILKANQVFDIGDVVIASVGSGETEQFKIFTYTGIVQDMYEDIKVKFHEGRVFDPNATSVLEFPQ